MYRKWYVIACVLSLSLMIATAGCSRKNVRHLTSDVSLVTPGKTTKQEVFNYLGQPDEEYKMADGRLLWVYNEAKKSMLRETPYIGEKIGKETYEVVKVTFNGDVVESVVYRSMSGKDFKEGGSGE